MSVSFTIAGEPKGKGRPRVVSKNGFSRAYTPKDTAMYENLVRVEYELQTDRYRFPDDAMLMMSINAYYPIPKSVSKKKHEQMVIGKIRPTKKPDADNIIKCIADSLNNVAYKDDSQIVDVVCSKYYSDEPRVTVWIEDLEKTMSETSSTG